MPAEQIQASVGKGGVNHFHDVMSVQTFINMCLPAGLRPLTVDGLNGPKTEAAIEAVQTSLLKPDPPDGRVDPVGPTMRFLRRHASRYNHRNRLPSGGGPVAPTVGAAPGTRPGAPAPASASTAPPLRAPAPSSKPGAGKPGSVPPDIVAAAQAANRTWHIPASITIAQWMVESGYGRHMPPGSNNPFGIKAASGQPYVEASTREEVHGQSVMMVQRFRKFDSIADAFDQHGKLLATARAYAKARSVLPDPRKFADALTGVYATDHTYGTMLKRQIAMYNLTQYD